MLYHDSVILLFAKAPIEGKVNTRLIADIGVSTATRLQHDLIHDRLSMLSKANLCDVRLMCALDIQHECFQECKQQYPNDFSRFMSFDGNFIIPNGESRAHHFERLCSWLRDISTFSNVLAITHGGSIDFLYRLGTNIPLHGGDRIFSSNNATLSIFEVNFPDVRLIDYSAPLLT